MPESTHLSILQNAMKNAYAPYSNYSVSALIITDSGQQYVGCNVENASYPEGLCAEASAISAMVVAGEKHIKQIYIMSQDKTGATPCGGCRQCDRQHQCPGQRQPLQRSSWSSHRGSGIGVPRRWSWEYQCRVAEHGGRNLGVHSAGRNRLD